MTTVRAVAGPVPAHRPDSLIAVAIGTFGHEFWKVRGDQLQNRLGSQAAYIAHVHGTSLHQARNLAIRDCADWGATHVICVDADDDLEDGYIAAMYDALDDLPADQRVLCQPATRGVYPDGTEDAEAVVIEMPARQTLMDRNVFVIGTMFRADHFEAVGGFADWPAMEDWDFFLRLRATGAKPIRVRRAVYRVGVNENSRNSAERLGGPRIVGALVSDIRKSHKAWCAEHGIDPLATAAIRGIDL